MKIIHTANAGVIFQGKTHAFAIDALHDQPTPPFSSVSADMFRQIQDISVDALFYTHMHNDHFSAKLTRLYLERHPGCQVVMPPHNLATLPLTQDQGHLDLGFVQADYARITHDGEPYRDVVNYGFDFLFEGKHIMVLGDGGFDAPELRNFCEDRAPDIVLVNFPYAALERGRSILAELFHPKQLFVYHLPFREADRFHFAESVLRRSKDITGFSGLLSEGMQSVEC